MAPLAFKKWQLQIEGEDRDRKDQATLDQRAKLQQELEVAHDDRSQNEGGRAVAPRVESHVGASSVPEPRRAQGDAAPARHLQRRRARAALRDGMPVRARLRGGGAGAAAPSPSPSATTTRTRRRPSSAARRGAARACRRCPTSPEGFFDDIDVNDWLMDLDHAAVLVQANWRAIACRQALLRAVRHASAAAIHAGTASTGGRCGSGTRRSGGASGATTNEVVVFSCESRAKTS